MGRPPVRSTKALVKAKLDAEATWKNTAKGRRQIVEDTLFRMVDRIDPIELIASVGLTFAVHQIIVESEEILIKARGTGTINWLTIWGPGAVTAISNITVAQIKEWLGLASLTPEQLKELEYIKNDPVPWLISFGIAYFLIHNGQQILSLPSTVAGFFGMVAA
jgi:hypothetical protein